MERRPADAPRGVPRGSHLDHDDDGAAHHDDDGAAHHDDDGAAHHDHDDGATAPTAASDDHHDDRTGRRGTAPPAYSEVGEATWYSAAPAGMCASPSLPFGTVLTVTNDATGASTTCTVDDREGAGYPRVVDMSPEGFAQIADLGEGVVEVTISW